MQTPGSSQPSGDSRHVGNSEVQHGVHRMWAAVAGAWKEHAEYVDARAAPISEKLIAQTAVGPGDRVLELACGPGGLGLEVAGVVGPRGQVVLTDVAQAMTDIALARAGQRGLRNVSGHPMDLEANDEADASYDVVLCREGLMFAADPARAIREMHRVLKPGGRVALSVWGPRSRNPWLGLLFDAASEVLGRPVPPDGIPGPFSLGEAGQLASAFADSEFADVSIEEVAVDARAPSFDNYWNRTSALAGPLTKVLASVPQAAQESLKTRMKQAFAAYEIEGALKIPGVALVAAARRPDDPAVAEAKQ
jgi:SAM-dependent methyltransferase